METVKTHQLVMLLLQDAQDDKADTLCCSCGQTGCSDSSHCCADDSAVIICAICNNRMIDIQACHMLCPVCGSHLDCSDKGSFW